MQTSKNDIEDRAERLRNTTTRRNEFDRLITLYTEPLYWHARRIVIVHEDAEDIVQDTFIKAYDKIASFRGTDDELKSWLYRIATNTAISALRHYKRSIFASLDSAAAELRSRVVDECWAVADEELIRFQKIVLNLPFKQRLVFNLRYYDELSYRQIAEITDQKEDTLKVNYHHAIKRIKEELTR